MVDSQELVESSVPHQRLAQESEDMFERNISLWAMKRQEVKIISGDYTISGFLAGLDEYWVQIWGHIWDNVNNGLVSGTSFHLVSKESISLISPTGNSTKDLSAKDAEEIEGKIKNFSNVSHAFNMSLRENKDNKEGKNAGTVGDSER